MYRHRQVGYVTLVSAGVAAVWTGALAWRERLTPLWLLTIVLLGVALLFASLTIEIRDGELRSHFGPGFWRKRVPLADVADAALVPSLVGGVGDPLHDAGLVVQRVGHGSSGSAPPVRRTLPTRERRTQGTPRRDPGGDRSAASLTARLHRRAEVPCASRPPGEECGRSAA